MARSAARSASWAERPTRRPYTPRVGTSRKPAPCCACWMPTWNTGRWPACESALRAAGRALSAWPRRRRAAAHDRRAGRGPPGQGRRQCAAGLRETLPGARHCGRRHGRPARPPVSRCRKPARQLAGHALDDCGFDTLADGFAITYRGGRRALRRAAAQARPPSACTRCARRSNTTSTSCACCSRCGRGPLGAVHAQADHAAELLGLHHDCAVLRARLAGSALSLADKARIDALAAKRQDALAPAALDICRRLYAERGASYTRRLKAYWQHPLRPTPLSRAPCGLRPPVGQQRR